MPRTAVRFVFPNAHHDDEPTDFPMQYGLGAVYPINDKPVRGRRKAERPIGFVHFKDEPVRAKTRAKLKAGRVKLRRRRK